VIRSLIEQVRHLPGRLRAVEGNLTRLVESIAGLHDVLRRPLPAPIEPTYVYVLLPQTATDCPPIMAQRASVPEGTRMQLCFDAYRELPAGLWVVAVGPASVRGVKVGNQFQSSMTDLNGQVCRTSEPLQLGVRLVVELEAPERFQAQAQARSSRYD
jgi:hypothetical protein